MTETTEEIIGAGYQTVDPEKGTISIGPINPNEKKPGFKDWLSSKMDKSGARGALESLQYMFGIQKGPFTAEEQAKLDDMEARKNQTVGNPTKADVFKKVQEANVTRSTTPPRTWQPNPK